MTQASDSYHFKIPDNVDRNEFLRSRVFIERDRVSNTSSSDFPGNWSGYDDCCDITTLKDQLAFDIKRLSRNKIEFDMIGLDASFANTLRRILIAEVPSMAIESVYIENNTSCMQDEVLSHRLGLIPLHVDASKFNFKGLNQGPDDSNTLVFSLNVRCDRVPGLSSSASRQESLTHPIVYSGDISWLPQGAQAKEFANDPICPSYNDIIVTKLAANQEIKLTMHAVKGIGRDHAKFSPVATAFYRILPEIRLLRPIIGEEAVLFQNCFAKGVIEIDVVEGVKQARVANPRKDMVNREVFRHPQFQDAVVLSRVRNHFLFEVESANTISPVVHVIRAFQVLAQKCEKLLKGLENITTDIN